MNHSTHFLLFFLLSLPLLSFSDPRISQSGLFCGTNKAKPNTNYVPTFVKEMETLSQLITTTHFATYHLNTSTSTSSQPIYALAQCHLDLSQTDCLLCYAASRTKLPRCLPSLSARIYLDGCFLRYDTYNFYHEILSSSSHSNNTNGTNFLDTVKCSDENVTVSDYNTNGEFVRNVGFAIGNVTRIAVKRIGGFGVVEVKGVYALAQCWESIDKIGCRECLEKAGNGVSGCGLKREGRGMYSGCYLRYSDQKFFNHGGESEHDHEFSGPGTIIAIALAVVAFVMLFIFAAYAGYVKLSKMKEERNNLGQVLPSFKRSYLTYKYEALEKATNYFNPSKKLGQGGAGSVFLGTFRNGETVAVKRLIFNTRQWVDEFFNEVNLISKIEHKNLVKLLGCSIEGPESLLVYEYVPNKSLDQFLFDKNKTKLLNWKQRFNIIVGTAEGLAYLHEGSEVRIIHRDIKSSNVLLDEDLTAKIADFGLARCFAADKTHLSTAVAGTLGYMAPEYLVRGQLTEKADVYSFGILVLEIVCGRRSNSFTEDFSSLLLTVWTLYRSNKLVEAVDPSLNDDFPAKEASNVLQIGLLCTQARVSLRPSMTQVVRMLTNENCDIPIPNQPPFLNAGTLEASTSTMSHSTGSLISYAATKFEGSYTSSESSSSMPTSDEHSRSRELTQK